MSLRNRLILRWDDEHGRTKVQTVSPFNEMDIVSRLDFLRDCVFEITTLYNKYLDEAHKEFKEKRATKNVG